MAKATTRGRAVGAAVAAVSVAAGVAVVVEKEEVEVEIEVALEVAQERTPTAHDLSKTPQGLLNLNKLRRRDVEYLTCRIPESQRLRIQTWVPGGVPYI